ncbi:predicted protein [Chaetomium globosum CBS 148.51]|uniref:Uncharacterized protein n=1 Tax=Chaetomium globosum (strain ATCC 6205 / CBS 148.51 / DSM 1962 / NBRC 6347 / NRRL 1970) TaxID=306901 RepID=Q2H5P0_CHAGB|nr:uncharacterized protein CHGG_06025 [Chaetomium globosum CBS 148.51]EAQ89406.1 predicted protein [Chaetomium globosum CBS 148.51]
MELLAFQQIPTFVLPNRATAAVADLCQFYDNIHAIVLDHRKQQGRDHSGFKALSQLCKEISKIVVLWRNADDQIEPPNLKPLIEFAQHLEDRFGKGGVEDETKSEKYIRFISARARDGKQQTQKEDALVVMAENIKKALNPTTVDKAGVEVQQEIHGPWILVTVDGYWAEGSPVAHHRPNAGDFDPLKKDLSCTEPEPWGEKVYIWSRSAYSSPQMTFLIPADDAREVDGDPLLRWNDGESDFLSSIGSVSAPVPPCVEATGGYDGRIGSCELAGDQIMC